MQKLKLVPVADIPKEIANCPEGDLKEIYRICLLLSDLCTKENGIGISASQVGIPWKLYLIKSGSGHRYFLNCSYEGIGNKSDSLEGCLSLKKENGDLRYYFVKRFDKIKVIGKELLALDKLVITDINLEFINTDAIVHQHEIEHCFGILISDIGVEYTVWR